MNTTRKLSLSLSALLLLGVTLAASPFPTDTGSQDGAIRLQEPEKKARDVSQYNLGKDQLAISGFDPVAYFPEGGGKALKGLKEIEHVHEGVRYYFASERTRKLFTKEPAKYEPRYGGWCAYAMATGEKVEIDPKSFHVDDDNLFVFFKGFFNDTRKKWLKNPAALERDADRAWAELLARK